MVTETPSSPPNNSHLVPNPPKYWTDQGIKSMKGKKTYRVDRCLYIRGSDSGTKRWVFRWRKDCRLRDMGLGSYGKAAVQVSLAEARQLAAKYREFL
jgi:hypothetical protein